MVINNFQINYLILACSLLWLISFIGFFFSNNFIILLISLELMFLSICTILCTFSFLFDDISGQVFALFIIIVAAVESAIALALYSAASIRNDILENNK